MARPGRERVRLTSRERLCWALVLAKETRQDTTGRQARAGVNRALEDVEEAGGWCACPVHVQALTDVLPLLWREPPE